MRATMAQAQWFGLWSVAFYATALGYVFEARGAVLQAVTVTLFAIFTVGCCIHTALSPDRTR